MSWGFIEITRTSERTIAVLHPFAFQAPVRSSDGTPPAVQPAPKSIILILVEAEVHRREREAPGPCATVHHRRSKSGFFVLSHARVRPLTYGEPSRFETIPSRSIQHA
jgi:hypothetical protein